MKNGKINTFIKNKLINKMENKYIIEKLITLSATVNNYEKLLKHKSFSKEEKEFIKNSKTLNKLILRYFEKVDKEIKFKKYSINANKLKISVKKYLSFLNLGNEIANCFDAGYSMGGIINVYVKYKQEKILVGKRNSCEEYAKSTIYKAKHGYNEITIDKKYFERIKIIGGIPTITLEKEKISKCLMLISSGVKNNYKIYFKEGFITNNYHSESFADCQNWRKKEVLNKIKERTFKNKNKSILKKFVGFKHSLMVGNCEIGTKMFANKHNLNIEYGYTIEYLISLEPNNIFVNKLLKCG